MHHRLISLLLFGLILPGCLQAGDALPADQFLPGKDYGSQSLVPAMPEPLWQLQPDFPIRDGVERIQTTMDRAKQVILPPGCRLLSHKSKVSSGSAEVKGDLQLVTDGERSSRPGNFVDLGKGRQWIQIDLGDVKEIHCIWMWQMHASPEVFQSVRIEVAKEPDRAWGLGWTRVFSTDQEANCCGECAPYFQLHTGYPVADLRSAISGRYVRLGSGNPEGDMPNQWTEVAVYGRSLDRMPSDFFRPTEEGTERLEPEMPRQYLLLPPTPWPRSENLEPADQSRRRLDGLRLQAGCRLLSHHCPVRVSDTDCIGVPEAVTDGIRQSDDQSVLDMGAGRQWVEIDLGTDREIHCVWLWFRNNSQPLIMKDVQVEIRGDGGGDPVTVFNTDHDASSSPAKGKDKEWHEELEGRPVTFPPVVGRYVTVRMNGSSLDDTNPVTEVAVYGEEVPQGRALMHRESEQRLAQRDTLELTGKIRELILKGSPEIGAADMQAYTGKAPRTGVEYRMVPIPGGDLLMGSPPEEKHRRMDEGPRLKVSLEPFWMGAHEVTWRELLPFLGSGDLRLSQMASGTFRDDSIIDAIASPTDIPADGFAPPDHPASGISGHAALKYCQWLSAQTGHFYRLPSEAEWEHAARAGSSTAWFFGDDPAGLSDYGWFYKNSAGAGHPAGGKKPNKWGLYDVCGSVMEWTLDEYSADCYARLELLSDAATMPIQALQFRGPRVARGGSWDSNAGDCRSASRAHSGQFGGGEADLASKRRWYSRSFSRVGFRIVRPLKVPSQEVMHAIWNQESSEGVRPEGPGK